MTTTPLPHFDPGEQTVEWFVRDGSGFTAADRSGLLDISATELSARIHWR